MKLLRILKRVFLIGLLLLVIFLLTVFIWHKIASSKEAKLYEPIGQMVTVNDHKMHVYIEGEHEETLVFMSGAGTSSPYYDFKPLWSKLSQDYTIVVVEKAGYGYSEVADVSRDIDTMLSETRQALDLAGIHLENGVYLVPHSMSGLEAIRWAQEYPSEVKGIIGLDPAVPSAYDELEISYLNTKLVTFMSRVGLLRLIPSVFESSAALKTGELTKEDIDAYHSLFNRKTMTKNMLDEMDEVKKNAEIVEENGVPVDTPMVFFISNGKEVGIDNWQEMLIDYTEQVNEGSYFLLDVGHYVHNEDPDTIIEEINNFITQVENEGE